MNGRKKLRITVESLRQLLDDDKRYCELGIRVLADNERAAIEETLQIFKDLYGISVYNSTPTCFRGKRFRETLDKIRRM